ncbi:MAG: AmmeMemoRadiSam system protein B [Rhodospirillaceae bacterium]|nr:AmmeMemoRadiSam system protein B [Rhodospirillaceae bacterium]
MAHGTATTRPAALAGTFYPADPDELRAAIAGFLAGAGPHVHGFPKALIVPHAGYIYSGAVAGKAYALLKDRAAGIRRVVLLGPTHRVYVRGLAAPKSARFATPLGDVAIDRAALESLKDLPQIVFNDDAHAMEHALEVQLPFLQRVAPDAALMPLAVGDTNPRAVAEVLARFWADPETVIVISSDLSHFHSYDDAKRRDSATATSIEHFAGDELSGDRACGFLPIAGLLALAKKNGARIERVDLRNSGDTAGPRDRVVGYGAWAIYEAST